MHDTFPWLDPNVTRFPSMIMWRADFSKEDPFFRLSFDPNETKASMVRNITGFEIQTDESPNAILDINTRDGIVICVGSWEAFLGDASDEQVKEVLDCLNVLRPCFE